MTPRRNLAAGLAVGLILGVYFMIGTGRSLPDGPDGDIYGTGYFDIFVQELSNAPLPIDTYDRARFDLVDGWDFGDRPSGYRCAWSEYFAGSNERFEVHFELVADYLTPVQINDKFGAQQAGTSALCGDGTGNGVPTADGSDHFPHLIHPGDGITFYENGQPMLDPQGDPVSVNLANAGCDKGYWVPGDEPGEAWLWWDEDGPTFSHSETEGELPCGGGPGEPVAVVRLSVKNADPDVGYCTHSLHEDQCFNVEPPPTPVQLGSGRSVLACPDGSTPAVETTSPLVVAC